MPGRFEGPEGDLIVIFLYARRQLLQRPRTGPAESEKPRKGTRQIVPPPGQKPRCGISLTHAMNHSPSLLEPATVALSKELARLVLVIVCRHGSSKPVGNPTEVSLFSSACRILFHWKVDSAGKCA